MKNSIESAKYGLSQSLKPQLAPLTLAIGGILSAGWAQADTITVTTLAPGTDADECTLRSAMITASTGSPNGACPVISGSEVTIEFGGLSGTIYELNLEAYSLDSLTIDGNEQITIAGNGTARILDVMDSVDRLVLDGLTITGGSADSAGGGVRSRTKHIEIHNSVITGNEGTSSGGAIHAPTVDGGSAQIHNSRFEDNVATLYGGGGLAISLNDGPVEIRHSEFKNNETNGAGGGGLVILNESDSSFSIKHNTFVNNHNLDEDSRGGALYANVASVDDGTFAYNSVRENSSGFAGGGVHIRAINSDIEIRDNDIEQNHAEYGGGFAADLSRTDLAVLGQSFEANTSDDIGAGMFIETGSSSEFTLEQTTFLDNVAGGCGGGLAVVGELPSLGVSYSSFVNNEGTCGGGIFISMIDIDEFEGIIEHSEISGNSATGQGGGIFSSLYGDSGLSLAVRNSTLSGNTGTHGAGLVMGGHGELEISYSTFKDNEADVYGGGMMHISYEANTCQVINSVFQNTPDEIFGGPAFCDVAASLLANAQDSTFNNLAGNILDEDPELGPLSNHGGIGGRTHRPQESSPIIEAGQDFGALPDHDQRGPGFARQVGDGLDMGAYESQVLTDAIFSDRFEEQDEDPGDPDDPDDPDDPNGE